MPVLEDKRHLQGLQIEDGIQSDSSSGRIWVAAFIVREAILIAPENMVSAEEVVYFDTVNRFIVNIFLANNRSSFATDLFRPEPLKLQTRMLVSQHIECRTSSMPVCKYFAFQVKRKRRLPSPNSWTRY